ncbi:hypothetical protein KC19_7G081000 [Ceratodon purpureus]|uniref:Uncharacterized protein n=1 Tax=Ceratodon purpureus TaxID=3225 RepID=A0A8T0H8V2_CERPU|nr:hypothetical protein KC19_7G081000 [Ceratodon purpureus]
MGDMSKAGTDKTSLEERQRVEKKMREAKHEEFTPRWFKTLHPHFGAIWKYPNIMASTMSTARRYRLKQLASWKTWKN